MSTAPISRRVSIGGGAMRVKRNASPLQSTPEKDVPTTFETSEQLLSGMSPSYRNLKRRKSAMGLPGRVKTPVKSATVDSCTNCERELADKENIHRTSDTNRRDSNISSCEHDVTDLNGEEKPWEVDDFTLGKPLGKGKFGNVYLAREKSSKKTVAMKVLFKTPLLTSNCVHSLRREVEIHCRLKHRNIVQLFGYFHDEKNIYLILDFLPNGELFRHIAKQGGRVSEQACLAYIRSIMAAVAHMHSLNVLHRDLKPENVLLGPDGSLKVADFGCAVLVPPPHIPRLSVCGTPEYLSPEMLTSSHAHSFPVDMWAIGIFMFELLVGSTPFVEQSHSSHKATRASVLPHSAATEISSDRSGNDCVTSTYQRIQAYATATPGESPVEDMQRRSVYLFDSLSEVDNHVQSISTETKDIIAQLLHPCPGKRVTATQLLELIDH